MGDEVVPSHAIRTDVMHGLLEHQWLATASHSAAVWGRYAQHSPHPCDCVPEAAPQPEACGPRQIYGLEITHLKMWFRAVTYFIVASGHV